MQYYRERLHPSVRTLAPVVLVIPASIIVFAPINLFVGFVVAAVLFFGAIGVLVFGSPVVTVQDGELRAGRAHIPIDMLEGCTVFRGTAAKAQRGVELDARAWLCIRGWIDPVVRVGVRDPDDPTPYWLVSSRTPDRLVSAIAEAKARAL